MDRAAQQVYDAMVSWREKYPTFSKRNWGINQPKFHPGERYFYRILFCAYQADPDVLPIPTRNRIRYLVDLRARKGTNGVVFVTDQRVFVAGNFGKIIREWHFRSMTEARVLPALSGLRFATTEGVDGFVYLFPPVREALSGPDLAERLLTIEATHVLSSGGDYDAWLTSLRARLGAAGR